MKIKAMREPEVCHIEQYLDRDETTDHADVMWITSACSKGEVVCMFAISRCSDMHVAIYIRSVDEPSIRHECELRDADGLLEESDIMQFMEDFTIKIVKTKVINKMALSRWEKDELNFILTDQKTPMSLSDTLVTHAYLMVLEAKPETPPYTGARVGLHPEKAEIVAQTPEYFQNTIYRLAWTLKHWRKPPPKIYQLVNDAIVYAKNSIDDGVDLRKVIEIHKTRELIRIPNLWHCHALPSLQHWLARHCERLVAQLRYATNDGTVL